MNVSLVLRKNTVHMVLIVFMVNVPILLKIAKAWAYLAGAMTHYVMKIITVLIFMLARMGNVLLKP